MFQVRVAELRQYPSGRSAMVHYGAGANLRATMRAWADEHGPVGARYRHTDELGSRSPEQQLERLRARFVARFGHEPRLD